MALATAPSRRQRTHASDYLNASHIVVLRTFIRLVIRVKFGLQEILEVRLDSGDMKLVDIDKGKAV